MRTKGKLTTWNDDKGFGFITPMEAGKRVFVHISAFGNRDRRPTVGQVATYALSSDAHGRPCAIDATLAGDRLVEKRSRKVDARPTIGAVLFLIVVGALALMGKIPTEVLALYVTVSMLTFAAYRLDKLAARQGLWRTRESTLHLLSLAGGWPGALIAQHKFRHKTKKQSFRTVYRLTVLLNFGLFVWLLTPTGGNALKAFLDRAP
jgi:uncharacterized membrane protein YsdA (DUF1294 family)/cold shock CspA family protein